jgi:hypothetical protein
MKEYLKLTLRKYTKNSNTLRRKYTHNFLKSKYKSVKMRYKIYFL